MKRSVVVLLVLAAFMSLSAVAQKFSIRSTDAANYPQITVGIDVPDQPDAQQADFKVLEDGGEVQFTFTKDQPGTGSGAKAICFLIEASGYTYGKAIENFKKAVSDAIGAIGESDKINVCYFGKANADGHALNTLSAEFTGDKNTLKNELNSRINAVRDTSGVADVFKGIYECLDFINNKSDLPVNKMLIVISAAINKSRSPIRAEDCIDKATKFNIPIYTVTYKTSNRYAADNFVRISDKTNGKSQSAKSAGEITGVISDFVNSAGKNAVAPANSYTIEFTTQQSGEFNTFEIQYKDEKVAGNFAVPEDKISFWKKHKIWIIVFIVVIVLAAGLIIWSVMRSRKKKSEENERMKTLQEKNIQLQQQVSQSRDAKTQAVPQEPAKFDLKRTQIGGGGGAPTLMVSAGNFTKNFPMNKQAITIGRNAGNDVVIPEQTVSGNHATLANEGGNWFIIDNNSTNGTFVNGTRVNKQRVSPNDMIKLGAAFLKIQL